MTPDLATRALTRLERTGALRLVDAEFARLLRDRLGASPSVALAGALAMRAVSLGHSGFALDAVDRLLVELDSDATLPPHEDWAQAMRDSPLVAQRVRVRDGQHRDDIASPRDDATANATPLVFEPGRVALQRYARHEHTVATLLLARVADIEDTTVADLDTWLPPRIHALFGADPAEDAQARAADNAVRHRLTLLTGGPGTGKTTTVARILLLLQEAAHSCDARPPRIALAAPTGRAAARLGEAIDATLQRDLAAGRIGAEAAAAVPREAQTLHRLLGWQAHRVGFRHDAAHPLPFDVVVVDEASMVDLPLMARLLAAVPREAKLLLIGDPDQLPAVEAGDVLGALSAAADAGGALAARRVHLLRGYRQSGAASLQRLADAVRDGDGDAALATLQADAPELTWRHGNAAALADALREFALPAYRAVVDAPDPHAALRRAQAMRVLCALREGPFGAGAWNAWFGARLAAGTTPDQRQFFRGRLLLITANDYRHKLYNGDVGVAWLDDAGEQVAVFDNGTILRPGQLPAHDSAFATTVHKAQGSEFDAVALVLPEADARVCTRELLYTGITRARNEALLWGSAERVRDAVGRRTWRDSGLAQRLCGDGRAV
jgi:exodeoxyribonuclease V alpha subunit